jgi:glycosyltransferase involved in cell wall biosynthesis
MNKEILEYVLITPAYNEEKFIGNTIQSVIKQTAKPKKWIIVSDGSTDKTDDIIKSYLNDYDWIEYLRLPEHRDRQFAAKITAFNSGFEKVKELNYDIIVSLDSDITFESDYIEYLLNKFIEFPELGVAGTKYIELNDRVSTHNFFDFRNVSGACQLFRKECFNDIGGYIPIKSGGVDTVPVITARMKGWKTQTFIDKVCHHHRKVGTGRINNILYSWFNQGEKDYYLGNHPLWEFFRCIYQMSSKPYIIGSFFIIIGYIWEFIFHNKRPVSNEFVKFYQNEQMNRLKDLFKRKN